MTQRDESPLSRGDPGRQPRRGLWLFVEAAMENVKRYVGTERPAALEPTAW